MRISDEHRARLAALPDDQRLMAICMLRARLWQRIGRANQKPPPAPDPWFVWYFQAGRGSGKTRSASEWVIEQLGARPGTRGFLLGPTMRHVMQVMLQGESGVLSLIGDAHTYKLREMKNEVQFVNGSSLILYTAERQDLFRGNEFHYGWIDEPAELERGLDAFETISPAVRLNDGNPVHMVITGTPKQVPLTRYLEGKCQDDDSFLLAMGSTLENMANLDDNMIRQIELRKGSRWYRQEVLGELLRDAEDALWDSILVEDMQIRRAELPKLDRKILAVDPALSTDKKADETGIILGGCARMQRKAWDKPQPVAVALADYSVQDKPLVWARLCAKICVEEKVNELLYERNVAGPMIEDILKKTLSEHAPRTKLTAVTVNRSKMHRAEPVSSAGYAGRVLHCTDYDLSHPLHELETQLTTWSPSESKSPDRLDAYVHFVDRAVIRTGRMSAVAPDRFMR